MKIGIYGDSFSEIQSKKHSSIIDESWVTILKNEGYNITCYGLSGTSIWYSYEKYLEHHAKYDVNIFTYSHQNRIHHLPEYLAGFNGLRSVEDIYKDQRHKNIQHYEFQELLSVMKAYIVTQNNRLDNFIANNVFNHVNYLATTAGSRLINILPFLHGDNKIIDLSNRTGPCLMGLHDITRKEESRFKITPETNDTRSCHLTFDNNMALTKIIKQLLTGDNMDIIELFNRPEFVYNDSHIRYFT